LDSNIPEKKPGISFFKKWEHSPFLPGMPQKAGQFVLQPEQWWKSINDYNIERSASKIYHISSVYESVLLE
jgi:hypothetical protein